MTGQAAPTQEVRAGLICTPPTASPGSTIGCVLTVTNDGVNTANQVVVTDTATGGEFLSSSDSRCTPDGDTMTCVIGTLSGVGTAGSTFSELHELRVAGTEGSFAQRVEGRFSPKPNSRGSDTIDPVVVTTMLDGSADFDGTFASLNGASVQTGAAISGNNPYTTTAIVTAPASFAAGLSVREQAAGTGDLNCPSTGCFGGQVIQFDISPLMEGSLPAAYTLTITIVREALPNGTKAEDLDVRHDGELVPLCPATDSVGACISSRTIERPSGNAIIVIQGPGDGNGRWGVG